MTTLFILKFWGFAWLLSVLLLTFRKDFKPISVEIISMLIVNNAFTFIISVLLIYAILPFTIPYSIANILKND